MVNVSGFLRRTPPPGRVELQPSGFGRPKADLGLENGFSGSGAVCTLPERAYVRSKATRKMPSSANTTSSPLLGSRVQALTCNSSEG